MNRTRCLALLALSLFFTAEASADWSVTTSQQVVRAVNQTVIRHEWTTATDSTTYDISSCSGGVDARFDPSVLDGSTDARVEIRTCRNSGDTWQRCRGVEFTGVKDGVTWTAINATTPGENYILAHPIAGTSGGDTARVEVRCSDREALQESNAETGGSGLVGWPSFELIGGTGRPTQAIVIDSLAFSTKLSGSGRDDDGSTWGGSCTGNATHDQPCTQSTDSITGLSISIDGAGTARSANTVDVTASDPQLSLFCRDSSTFAHEIGTASDTGIAADGDYIATVIRDATGAADGGDLYRVASLYTADLNCSAGTGQLSIGGVVNYPTATADDLMLFIMDAVHLSPYGGRWTAQEVLTAAWDDMFPEMLGLTNLITNGYMETTCSSGSPLTESGGGGWAARAGATTTPLNRAIVGQGCEFSASGDTDARSAATATISARPGEYYVGSVALASGGAGTTRSVIVRIRDNTGTNISNAKFWIGGQSTGVSAESANVIDATSVATPGEIQLQENSVYGGTIVKFAFFMPAGTTGFDVQFAQTDVTTQYSLYIDELWVRKKTHQDLERHYVIADGRAKIQLFTDSRGLPTRYEPLQESLNYMLGETTANGQTRSAGSIRPDLHLTEKVSEGTYSVSGQRLGNYVGENDGYETYAGVASTVPTIDSLIEQTTNYCIAYYGINDLTAGARPTSAALASDSVANRHLYWADQLRGFEIASEKAGCIPIVIMEPVIRGDTTTTTCSNASGSALNCASWHQEAWKNVLHNGLP